MKLYCAHCLKPFESNSNGQLYCTKEHRAQHIEAERKEKIANLKAFRTSNIQPSDHDYLRRANLDEFNPDDMPDCT